MSHTYAAHERISITRQIYTQLYFLIQKKHRQNIQVCKKYGFNVPTSQPSTTVQPMNVNLYNCKYALPYNVPDIPSKVKVRNVKLTRQIVMQVTVLSHNYYFKKTRNFKNSQK